MSPKISVLIPVYNAGKYLPACLLSLSSQTFTDFEIICINDGSADNSAEILQQIATREPRLQIITQKNAGVAATRNRLIQKATGDYVAFVDADDVVDPSYLEKLYQAAEKNHADITKCFFKEISEDGSRITPAHCARLFYQQPSDTLASRFENGYYDSVVWGKLWRREWLLQEHLVFRPNHVAEDLPFVILAYMLANSVSVVATALYFYRKGVAGAITQNSEKMAVDILRNLAELHDTLRQRKLVDPQVSFVWIKTIVWSVARFRKFPCAMRQKHQDLVRGVWTLIEQETENCFFLSRVRWRLLFWLVKLCGWDSVYRWA